MYVSEKKNIYSHCVSKVYIHHSSTLLIVVIITNIAYSDNGLLYMFTSL